MDYTHMMSRTLYCLDCNAHGRPKKNNWFIVYGSNHQEILIKKNHQDGTSGFTPHLLWWNTQAELIDGKVHLFAMCAIHGCGCNVQDLNSKLGDIVAIDFLVIKENFLTEKELLGLIKFKNSGYELI